MALQKRLNRQNKRARRRAGRRGELPEQQPAPVPVPATQWVKGGGSVESYQDQVVRKFGGGRIKTKK